MKTNVRQNIRFDGIGDDHGRFKVNCLNCGKALYYYPPVGYEAGLKNEEYIEIPDSELLCSKCAGQD